ncbi:MAG: TIGR02147 family protein [Proteobacteria bacterium]|nr:MAG: TIGR02147 family protein [Pseudomonadota bacterium]
METNRPFRLYLRNELLKRAKRNPRFSIRAFARQMGVESSSLAQILSGKRALTDQMCERLAKPLALSPAKMRTLLRSVPDAEQDSTFQQFQRLQEDQFQVIADWYYYAILELTRTDHFKGDLRWIARVLGITTAEVRSACEKLKDLGHLTISQQGVWKDTLSSTLNLGNEYTNAAFREHQKQLLRKAEAALEDIPYSERVQSSMMLVGSRARVQEAKKRILHFIEELDEFLKTGDTRDEVYTLSVSLFPVSQIQKLTVSKGQSI